VVDDDPIICEIAESILAEAGWDVARALSPAEALNSMASQSWPVVLCDVHLPGDSGQLLKSLRSDFPLTQVIMITGDPSLLSMRQAMQAGAYDYLLKPMRRDDILRVAEMALDRFALLWQKFRLEEQNNRYREQLEALVGLKTDQLRDSELRYRTLFDNAVDAIFLVNPSDGTIEELNGAASRLIGRKSIDIQNTSVHDYVGSQLDECISTNDSSFKIWRLSELLLRDAENNEHVTNATISRIRLDTEVVLQIVLRDRGDYLELDQRTGLMELELMSEQRLANIGLLASGVAHNINTPLMGIYGLAQVIKMKHPDIEDVDGVLAQVERINGIIRNLMWKSRQEQELAKQDIDLNVLLQEELRFLEADMEFKHNVDKTFLFAPDIPPIYGRYSDFSQSLLNIIRNALDAMHKKDTKSLEVQTSRLEDEIVITIKDTGKGLSLDLVPRIFEPFFTTKPAVGKANEGEPTGTGLGLSTVKKLLSPYGCRFDVQSEIGRGTAFHVYVPIARNQPTEGELEEIPE